MNTRFYVALCAALSLSLTACPDPEPTADAGVDAGPAPTPGTCAEDCQAWELCDEASRTCVPGCAECPSLGACINGCPQGSTCTNNGGAFACVDNATTCGEGTCSEGQEACVDGNQNCTCLTSRSSSGDSCWGLNRSCEGLYNSVTGEGGECRLRSGYESCSRNTDCQSGLVCQGVFAAPTPPFCLKSCTGNPGACSPGETCEMATLGAYCLWSGAYIGGGDNGCLGLVPEADGGYVFIPNSNDGGVWDIERVTVSAKCVPKPAGIGVTNFTTPVNPENNSGTCHRRFIDVANDTPIMISNCEGPGQIAKYGSCVLDRTVDGGSEDCSAGLTCVPLAGADGFVGPQDRGICLDVCNAATPIDGVPASPTCAQPSTACVNYQRQVDRLGVVGACAATCDVFSGAANFGCASQSVGGTTVNFACVPVPPNGDSVVSADGSGVCLAPYTSGAGALAAEGAACAVTDAFQGASCASGLVCNPGTDGVTGTCRKACDLECSGANPPARCASLQNETCAANRTCTAVSSDPLVKVGLCF